MHLKSRIGRGESGTLETERGTLYVSKPYRSKSNKSFRAMMAFVPRKSHFDLSNAASGNDEFRGFFALFWISMFILAIRTYVISFEQTGEPLSLGFASMFSRHATTLALSDAAMVLSTILFCVPFATSLKHGWMRYNYFALALQHTFQTALLATTVIWTYNRQWPWVQSGFLTLHTLVMMMKVHSYLAHNGYLSVLSKEAAVIESNLRKATVQVGGWEKALLEAEECREFQTISTESSIGTPSVILPEDATKTYYNGPAPAVLKNRLLAAADAVPKESLAGKSSPLPHTEHAPHPLIYHPDHKISKLAQELTEVETDLVSTGPQNVRWPENVGWANYFDYLLVPSLVYDIEYPRTDRIRPLYILEKTAATFGTFTLLYVLYVKITAHSILPFTPTPDQSFFRALLDLSLPFMLSYLLLFYLIFECICNAFAELSRFADRQFYEDWWNATSLDEFARKWNKPVHVFLLRHVYASAISAHRLSRGWATFWTFLLSAAVHELVMIIVTKKFRMYLFMMQMIQLPLIALGRLPAIKRNRIMGNIVFWIGLYAGFPLLCVAYCAY
ncbi:MBOAT, membrane-bound O-acyltransferase family-domain-containing protein [Hysterangium stoloniferum]|nr:MBOAT, membrane-bound O-acyltransferase family-domain-containing protein [Hysterangium stoloniferum]